MGSQDGWDSSREVTVTGQARDGGGPAWLSGYGDGEN